MLDHNALHLGLVHIGELCENPLKMIVKMLTHMHMVIYTWWCWHIYKGEVVGEDFDKSCVRKER